MSDGEQVDGILTIGNDSAKAIHRGRGVFSVVPQKGMEREVTFVASNGEKASAKLPKPEGEGVAIKVQQEGDSIIIETSLAGLNADSLALTIMHEGKVEEFHEFSSRITIHHSQLKVGIHQATVFDVHGRVFADRLFFVRKAEKEEPTLAVSGMKDEYSPYEKVELKVKGKRRNVPVSLSVHDGYQAEPLFDSGNIMTEMLLASEIKGFVPQPEWFFEREDEEHQRGLDLLMMTQGWRRFNWQEMAVKDAFELTHPAEYTQMITGTVNRYSTDYDTSENLYDDVLEEQYKILDDSQIQYNYRGTRRTSIDLNPFYDEQESVGAIADTRFGVQGRQNRQWIQNDYRSFSQSLKAYDKEKRDRLLQGQRRFIERGNLKKEVRVHAEFVNPYNPQDNLMGEMETQNGCFKIDLPRFEGECLFYIDASDTTKWKRKWDGIKKRKPRQWIQMEDDEYTRLPHDPEFYVRLN